MPRSSVASRVSASPTTVKVALAAAFAFTCTQARSDEPHSAEIKTFGSIMAIARTVRDNCPGVAPDEGVLEALRLRLHIVEADHPAFAPEAHAAADALKRGLAEASNRQAWCDAIFRLYGPEGTLIRGMLRR